MITHITQIRCLPFIVGKEQMFLVSGWHVSRNYVGYNVLVCVYDYCKSKQTITVTMCMFYGAYINIRQ